MNIFLWLILPLALLIGLWFLWLFGTIIAKRSETQTLEQELWQKQGPRSAERERALMKAKRTGDWTEYNTLKAAHDEEFRRDIKTIVDQETVIDEQTQYELENGINPYKPSPAPSGKLIRR